MNELLSRKRQSRSAHFLMALSLPLILLVIAGFAWHPLTGGDDFWAHASIGRWIFEHHRVPRQTLFLWSAHQPWIAHAWGTGLLFFGLMKLGGETTGPYLAQVLNLAFCSAPFLLLWRFWRQNAPFTSLMPPLFVLAVWCSAARFHPRPELFTALFLTLLYLFLNRWIQDETPSKASYFGVLFLFALWPNLHGAVAIGLVVLWITALFELARTRGKNGSDLRLPVLAMACTLIVFVCNPRGFEYYRVLLPIGSKTFDKIEEWKPFWVWPQLAIELALGEFLLWGLGMLFWAKNPNRRWAHLGWMLLMMAAFLKARRQLWLTALTSLAVLLFNWRGFESQTAFSLWRRLTRGDVNELIPEPMRLIARGGILVIMICAVAQAIPRDFWPIRAVSPKLPVRMAQVLKTKAPAGHIFNDYEFSAYLQWHFHEKRLLYIDLNNAYPDALMDEYFETMAGSKDRRELAKLDAKRAQIFARRKIRVVALRPFKKTDGLSILALYLNKNPGWKRIYKANDGTIWARR